MDLAYLQNKINLYNDIDDDIDDNDGIDDYVAGLILMPMIPTTVVICVVFTFPRE